MTFIFNLLFSLIPVAIAAIIISLIVFSIKRKGSKTEVAFTPQFLLKIYTYIVLLASLITFTAGASLLINSVFAETLGDDFSFQQEAVYEPEGPTREVIDGDVIFKEPKYEIPTDAKTKALIQGVTMTVFALIIGAIHLVVLNATEPKKKRKDSIMYRLFVTISLGIYTIGALVALPVGIYSAISFYLVDQTGSDPWNLIVPGGALSSAIVYVPLWILFIWMMFKLRKNQK